MKKYWDKLTKASKIMLVFWTFCAFFNLFSGESDISISQWFVTWIFGYIFLVGITQLISRKKHKSSPKRLATSDSLPIVVSSNIMLSKNEICHYNAPATFVKTKNVVVGYSGGSRGTSIHVAKGVSFRVGASKASPIRGNVQEKTAGILSITNKRVVFSANKGAFDKKISSLSAVTPFQNGIAFQFGEHQYPLETKDAEYIYQIISRIVESSETI